jgi:hypothetical protein
MSCTASRSILPPHSFVCVSVPCLGGRALASCPCAMGSQPGASCHPGPSVPNDGHCATCCFPCAGWLPQVLCDPGFFSLAGQNTCSACPAGRFGSASVWGLTTVACSGACVGGRSVNVEGGAPCFGPGILPRWVVRVWVTAVHDVRPHRMLSAVSGGGRETCAQVPSCVRGGRGCAGGAAEAIVASFRSQACWGCSSACAPPLLLPYPAHPGAGLAPQLV